MSELSSAEKAERRAKALARLQETKRAIEEKRKANQPSSGPSSQSNQPGQQKSSTINPQNRNADTSQLNRTKVSSLFAKPYIEYDFSTMEDSKGGFMVEEKSGGEDAVQKHSEWLESLANQQPPFDFSDPRAPSCFECGTKELEFQLWRVFLTRICKNCRRAKPEKYSLLTKTECKQDYLLTDSELRDKDILPHLERPNPYQQTYSNMMLYLRYQVEEFAWKKWGGPTELDAEWEKRQQLKKVRKQAKFEAKLRDMRNKTRAQAITKIGRPEKHVHIWGSPELIDKETQKRICGICGTSRIEAVLN